MLIPEFVNREKEVERIVNEETILLNIYGETGIGKSRLLQECCNKWIRSGSEINIFFVDFHELHSEEYQFTELILQTIIKQAPEMFLGAWKNCDQVAGLLVNQLTFRAQQSKKKQPCVILIFDTVETFQNNREVLYWLEHHFVRPLISERNIKMIFAGRIPIKWLDFEVRRRAEPPLRLEPLEYKVDDGPAQKLIHDLLIQKKVAIVGAEIEIMRIILDLSFGHPLLIERLINGLGENVCGQDFSRLSEWLCKHVVTKFLDENLLDGIPFEWREILWWISVLDHFDSLILRIYLNQVVPDIVRGRQDAYFSKGIRLLRERSLLIWKECQGEQFQGVVGKIIRKCFAITRRADYASANKAAAEAYRALVSEYLMNEDDLKRDYQAQAAEYDGRAMAEAA